MHYPSFYSKVSPIRLYDPLSDFLGAFENGKLEISYLDCVKLAGHSCPTVAGAYLMAMRGLSELYGDYLPERGLIKVEMNSAENEGVTGVVCNVISFIVGAGGAGGFKGIAGNFARDNLVEYNVPMQGEVTLTRTDTEQSVTLTYNPSIIMPDAMMQPLMQKCLQGTATQEEQKNFGNLWQERVEKILLSKNIHQTMISIIKD